MPSYTALNVPGGQKSGSQPCVPCTPAAGPSFQTLDFTCSQGRAEPEPACSDHLRRGFRAPVGSLSVGAQGLPRMPTPVQMPITHTPHCPDPYLHPPRGILDGASGCVSCVPAQLGCVPTRCVGQAALQGMQEGVSEPRIPALPCTGENTAPLVQCSVVLGPRNLL